MNKAFFLDRDGTVNAEVNYLHRPEDVALLPGSAAAIRAIHDAGYLVVVVSNQSGVARGMYTMADVTAVERRLTGLLAAADADVDAFYYCPHYRDGTVPELAFDCSCRKPKPGMLVRGAAEHVINLARSFMIGDRMSDLEAGKNAGCAECVLVRTGYGARDEAAARAAGFVVQNDLAAAVNFLLKK